MGKFLTQIVERAKAEKQTIVLPEGSDIRTVQAARMIMDEGIADVIILGSEDEILAHGVDAVLNAIRHGDNALLHDLVPDHDAVSGRLDAFGDAVTDGATGIGEPLYLIKATTYIRCFRIRHGLDGYRGIAADQDTTAVYLFLLSFHVRI